MKITKDNKDQYAIKYKVLKINKNNFLMYPVCLLKGKELENGFKTSTELIPCLYRKEDLSNRYLVDSVYDIDELEYVYDYEDEDEDDEEFVSKYFFEECKDTIILVDVSQDGCISKVDIDLQAIKDRCCDVVYCTDKSIPVALINQGMFDELLKKESKEELALTLKKCRETLKQFQDASKDKKITRIYMSNGKVEYIETLKKAPDVEKEVEKILNEEMDKMDGVATTSEGISYQGLVNYLKERIYGHNEAIETLAQKIFMNYTAEKGEAVESILLVGPTGTGKTETVKAACDYLNLPSYEVNASNIVPQGIKGMSIEDVIVGLYEDAGRNLKKAEKGIIFLDEFDKLNDTSLELKDSVKNILLTFTAGGRFPIDNDRYKFDFDSSMTTKIYAGVFDKINEKIKSLGFNSVLEFQEALGSEADIRKKIIDKKYFTLEELSRISTILAYNELDRETKKQILTSSKLSEFIKKRERYRRQFKIDLVADESYIDAVLDSLSKDASGMRSVNNYVKSTINEVERAILRGETKGYKQLILTRNTVDNPNNFELK